MARIEIARNHQLGREKAQQRARVLVERLEVEGIEGQAVIGSWKGDIFMFQAPAPGTLTITNNEVRIVIELPWIMLFARSMIEARINQELDIALSG